jgi:tetratricopeptide (TPR) repeat protein
VAADIDLFRTGTRLLQRGQWREALAPLEAFRDRFPGREVLNNLGLAHFGLGRSSLGACAAGETLRFKLPFTIETRTRAERGRARGGDDRERCRSSVEVQRPLAAAEDYLRRACEKDRGYVPARLNLGSVLIMKGDLSAALAEADALLREQPGNGDATNLKAVALYLYGVDTKVDAAPSALALLGDVPDRHPARAAALYNRATILYELGRGHEAREVCEAFRLIERSGRWADACGGAGR